jgi:hypothetical protein
VDGAGECKPKDEERREGRNATREKRGGRGKRESEKSDANKGNSIGE